MAENGTDGSEGAVVEQIDKDREKKRGFFGRIILFLSQVVAELRKVVTPNRKELLTYTGVVLVFVVIMMAIISLFDYAFGFFTVWVFGDLQGE